MAKSHSRHVAEVARRRLAEPPRHIVIPDKPTGWERAELEAKRF